MIFLLNLNRYIVRLILNNFENSRLWRYLACDPDPLRVSWRKWDHSDGASCQMCSCSVISGHILFVYPWHWSWASADPPNRFLRAALGVWSGNHFLDMSSRGNRFFFSLDLSRAWPEMWLECFLGMTSEVNSKINVAVKHCSGEFKLRYQGINICYLS